MSDVVDAVKAPQPPQSQTSLAIPSILKRKYNQIMVCKELPKGQYFDRISINVKGIVTKHNNKSEDEARERKEKLI